MDRITMTTEELANLREELSRLETDGRRAMAARIKTAREWGDLKENAEYHSAKEDQAHLETKIARLRGQLRSAAVVEVSGSSHTVEHGSTVSYTDRGTNRSQTFTIVSPYDAKPAEGALSVASPIAKALIGHGVGDVVEVQTPTGMRALQIESIS
ncbi:MAG: transcription elongation factor GreA [Solirubrobacteraceae bacterium]